MTQVLQSPEDFHRLTATVLAECAANDVVYVEGFLSLEFCGGGDLSAWREYLQAIYEAAAQAAGQYGIIMRGIPTCIRHLGPERAKVMAREAGLHLKSHAGEWGGAASVW